MQRDDRSQLAEQNDDRSESAPLSVQNPGTPRLDRAVPVRVPEFKIGVNDRINLRASIRSTHVLRQVRARDRHVQIARTHGRQQERPLLTIIPGSVPA